MIGFFSRVLNAQIIVTLLGMLIPSAMRWGGLITSELWGQAFIAAVVTFVGGGLLKEGLGTLAKGNPT